MPAVARHYQSSAPGRMLQSVNRQGLDSLHQTFPTPDGTRAVCIWEAASIDALRNVMEPLIRELSRNEYFQVENREGFVRPSRIQQTAAAGR